MASAAERDAGYSEYFRLRSQWLRRVAFALCGDWYEADDLVQAAFLQLYRNWRRISPDAVDAYARRVLVNAYLSGLRRSRRRGERVVAEVPDTAVVAPTGVEDRLDLAEALAVLPPRQRAVIVLRYLEDLPIAQVAEVLRTAEGTVKSQTSRAMATLRAAMGEPADEPAHQDKS